MFARILSAVILVPAVLAGVYYARPWPLLVAMGMIGTLCLREYIDLIGRMGIRVRPVAVYAASWLLLIGLQGKWLPIPALLTVLLIVMFLAAIRSEDALRDRALSLMASVLGLAYPVLFLYGAIAVRFDFGERAGMQWFMIVLVTTWVGDSLALFTGRRFGRTSFAPKISPNKTNEGALGGLIGGIAAAIILQGWLFRELPLGHVFVVSILVGVFGQLGDLAESMLKRAAEVKDSSHLIPGHGGILDRIDSLLFAFPVTHLYLVFMYRQP
jgi:phosphatidate cytidylyltransferase